MKHYTYENTFTKEEPVCIAKGATASETENHTHDFIEIVYIASGSAIHVIDGHSFEVSSGCCLIAQPGEVHSYNGVFTYYNLFLLPEFMASQLITDKNAFSILTLSAFSDLQAAISVDSPLVIFDAKKRKEIEFILEKLYNEFNSTLTDRETAIQCCVMLFLNELFRQLTCNEPTVTESGFIGSQILQYIDEHYNEKLTLYELAQRCFYRPKYFSRLFKKYYGVTVSSYIQGIRLDHGKKLLSETSMSVEDIAREIGYSDSVAFYKYFKQKYGLTPGEFRKNKSTEYGQGLQDK